MNFYNNFKVVEQCGIVSRGDWSTPLLVLTMNVGNSQKLIVKMHCSYNHLMGD